MQSEYGNHKIRPFIIPVFLPHAGCPHQCVFCNQSSITGVGSPMDAVANIHSRIGEFLGYNGKTRKPVQIAFFGGNFLGIQEKETLSLLAEAAGWVNRKLVDSIRFSTRPDTIDPRRLSMIRGFPVATVELGVQSMDDTVLAMAKRGHTGSDTEKAVRLLKAENYEIGLQIMVGLPGDNPVKTFITAQRIVDLAPDFVRIYPTVVLAGSPLAGWYRKGNYAPLSLEACVSQVKDLYLLFKKNNIRVIRMGLQVSRDLKEGATILAGPYHPAFGHLVHEEIFFEKAVSGIKSAELRQAAICIRVNPASISKMRGLKNANIRKLKDQFQLKSVKIVPDSALAEDDLKIGNDQ